MKIVHSGYILRPWHTSDCASLAKQANNINIWNNVRDSFPHPYLLADAEAFIGLQQEKPYQQDFAIEVEGHAVGGIGIVPGSDVERLNAEVGYWLGEAYWGKGIMGCALNDVVEYVFTRTELIRLFATVYEHNHASMMVLKKAGFTRIATLHSAAIKNGQIIDLHYYERLKT